VAAEQQQYQQQQQQQQQPVQLHQQSFYGASTFNRTYSTDRMTTPTMNGF